MPTPLIKEGWADLLEPGIREWFAIGQTRRPSLLPQMFSIMNSTKDAEHMRGVGAIAPDAWRNFAKTKVISQVSFDQGYKKTFRHQTFMVELPVERELAEDNLYGDVLDSAANLGDSAMLLRESDGASVFNNAFDGTSYPGADLVALCSDSHPNGPTKSGTQDNNFALDLTKANVKTVREAMQAFKDDSGNLLAVTPNTLLVPPALEDAAIEIAQSTLDPVSANNAVNAQYGRWNVVVWHYLTDSNAWFMIDSVLMKQSLLWFDRVPLSIYQKVQDTSVFATFVARMRYSYGWRDWRWVAGSNPS